MRITQQMLLNNSIYTLSTSVSRLVELETMMSSGKRISKPSDDPIGTQQVLAYNTQLSEIEQYLETINLGNARLATYESNLSSINTFLTSAKEIALTMASDDTAAAGDVAWESELAQLEGLIDQIIEIGNTKSGGQYIYSGQRINNVALARGTNGVIYQGDESYIQMGIASNSRINGNLLGSEVFFEQMGILGEDSDLNVGLSLSTPLSDLNLGEGVDITSGSQPGIIQIVDNNLGVTYPININYNGFYMPAGAPTNVEEVLDRINGQLSLWGASISVELADSGGALKVVPTTPGINSVGDSTPLVNLNSGMGIDKDPGVIMVSNADRSVELEVDISSAETLGDVRSLMQAELDAQFGAGVVTVNYNPDRTGLQITDTTGGTLELKVEDVPGSNDTTASDLGIVGSIDPSLEGQDLSPQIDFTISDLTDQSTAADLGLAGDYHNESIGDAITPILTVDTPLSTLNGGLGFDLDGLTITQGDETRMIDLRAVALPADPTIQDVLDAINNCGLDIVSSINEAGTGIQIEHSEDAVAQTLIVESTSATDTTARYLGLEGSPDMLGSLILLASALERQDQELVGRLVENMDEAMDSVLSWRGKVGTTMSRLETTQNRHEENTITITELLSEKEDADIISLAVELATQENLYQAALKATSYMIQPSLLDFL